MKTDSELRASLTRIIRASRRVFANDDVLAAGHAVDTGKDLAARATLRTAIEDAERDLKPVKQRTPGP
jgi:hypothetical protein